ncbi:MAG: right-handed parallel beta-helix repeat-containing protein [Bacteroidota bacterium]
MLARFLVATALLLATSVALSAQTTFTVTTTANDGPGSLRQAILDANANAGADAIAFAIPGAGPHTIQVQTALPAVADAATIDGLTQPGADCSAWPATLVVEIDGSAAPADANGFVLAGDEVQLRGLVVGGFAADNPAVPAGGNGVVITGSDAAVTCSFVGAAATGEGFARNGGDGIRIEGAARVRIGGRQISDRVLATGNLVGIRVSGASSTQIQGSYLGPWASATFGFNRRNGVLVENGSVDTTIGGGEPGAGNLISGNSSDGIRIEGGAERTVVAGNVIGLPPDGSFVFPNNSDGIEIGVASETTIGGVSPGERNVISGNDGVGLALGEGAADTRVLGNFIGTDLSGTVERSNLRGGIFIARASGTTVGGDRPEARNVIAGNEGIGIEIDGTDGVATGNVIAGNYIGVDATGLTALRNFDDGILVENAAGNTIGGNSPAAGNVISGNGDDGIDVFDSESSANLIRYNQIGVGADGTTPIPNEEDGIDMNDAGANRIEDNVVAYNVEVGIAVKRSQGVQIARNSTFANGELGIDIDGDGVTSNDAGDGDAGANNRQNFPDLAMAMGNGVSTLTVRYTVDTDPANAAYPLTVAFHLADADGEEGQVFLGTDTYAVADAQAERDVSFNPAEVVPTGSRLVATATDADGNTSEFAPSIAVAGSVANEDDTTVPTALALDLAGPNPFRHTTALALTVPKDGPVQVVVYDLLGRRAAVLHAGPLVAGTHRLALQADGLSAGVYVVRAETTGMAVTQPLTVLR